MAAPAPKDTRQDFRDIADRGTLTQDTMYYKRSGVSTIAFQRTGFLAGVMGVVELNITTSAAGTWANKVSGLPTPENCIRTIRLRSNSGVTFYETSGFGNYLVQRVNRLYDYRNPLATFDSALQIAQSFSLPTTYAASTTYTLRFPIDLRNLLGERELISLLLLEGKGTIYLDIVWDDVENNLLTMTGGASITVNSITVTPEADVFLLPNVPYIAPAISPIHCYQTQTDPLTTTGFDKFTPNNGGTLLRVIMFFQNGDGSRIPLSSLGNWSIKFGGIMTPERGKIQNLAARMLKQYEGYALPSGVFTHDYLGGNGDASRMPGLRDTIPLRDANDVVIETEILSTAGLTAGATRTVILETLKRAERA